MWVIRPGHVMTAQSAPLRGMAWSHKLKKKERCVPKVGLAKELRSRVYAPLASHISFFSGTYIIQDWPHKLWIRSLSPICGPTPGLCEPRCASISLKWRLAHFSFPFFFLESRLSNKKTKRNNRAEIQRKRK